MTTMVNPDGFTFTSSSVYIAYEGVRATDLCTQIGTTISNITFAFARSSVTEDLGALNVPFNPARMSACTATTVPPRGIGSPAFNPHAGCFPVLQFQAAMLAPFQSIWSNCDNVTGLVLDPPIFLTAATALVSATTTSPDSSPTRSLAAIIGINPQSLPRSTGIRTTASSSVPGTSDRAIASATDRNDQWQSPDIQVSSKNNNLPSANVQDVTTADLSVEATASATSGNEKLQETTTQLDSKILNVLPISIVHDIATAPPVNGPGEAYKFDSAVAAGNILSVPRFIPSSIFTGLAASLVADPMITLSGTVNQLNLVTMNPSTVHTPVSSLSKLVMPRPSTIVAAGQTINIPLSGTIILTITGHTLIPGHNPITISGTVLSLASNALIIGTSTISFSSGSPSAPQPTELVPQPWEPTLETHITSVGFNGVLVSLTKTTFGKGIPDPLDGSAGDTRTDPSAVANTEAASIARDLGALINFGFVGASGRDAATTNPATTAVNGNSAADPFLGVASRLDCIENLIFMVGAVWMSFYCVGLLT